MSITRKQKSTEEYKRKLENLPPNTRRNKLRVVSNFEKFCKEYHNSTPENICKELLILKKQNEEEYIDTLYEILQDWINHISKTLNPNSLRTTFTNLRSYIYYFGIKTDSQDVKNLLSFPRVQKEEKYPLKHDQLLRIIQDQERFPVRKALYLACSSSGMRIGEAVQIKKSDLEFKDRIQINIRPEYTKTQTGRSVFVSKECQQVLETYLEDLKQTDTVFYRGKCKNATFVAANESKRLGECLDRLGLGMKYGSSQKFKISTHSLRAFFFTQAVRKHGENYAHRLTGHGGYLIQYDRMNDEEKLKLYVELEPELVVYDSSKQKLEIEKLKLQQTKEMQEMKEEMDRMKEQLALQGMKIIEELKKQGKIQ